MPIVDIKKLNIRDVFPNEARDFTPWLAKNLHRLEELTGLQDLELVRTEHPIGEYACDIVLKHRDGYVTVENQFYHSDHKHFGQSMVYPAGVKANASILVAEIIRDEHRSAIAFWQDLVGDKFSFFAIEVSAISLGETNVAINLDLVCQPNHWEQTERKGIVGDGEDAKLFWQEFKEYCIANNVLGMTAENYPNSRPSDYFGFISPASEMWLYAYRHKTGIAVALDFNKGLYPNLDETVRELFEEADNFGLEKVIRPESDKQGRPNAYFNCKWSDWTIRPGDQPEEAYRRLANLLEKVWNNYGELLDSSFASGERSSPPAMPCTQRAQEIGAIPRLNHRTMGFTNNLVQIKLIGNKGSTLAKVQWDNDNPPNQTRLDEAVRLLGAFAKTKQLEMTETHNDKRSYFQVKLESNNEDDRVNFMVDAFGALREIQNI